MAISDTAKAPLDCSEEAPPDFSARFAGPLGNLDTSSTDTYQDAAAKRSHQLDRKVFTTSRLSEFCSVKELTAQTGHSPAQWPLVILKELVDNALDEAEKSGVAPVVKIDVTGAGEIIVADNGHGIPADVVDKLLDYTSRTSDKEAYASPTRGAQGNALKTILAIPFALDGATGVTSIEARGIRHQITFEMDQVRREPRIRHEQMACLVRKGTIVTVRIPETACSLMQPAKAKFLQIAENIAFFNPHVALTVKWMDDDADDVGATDPDWRKWSPSDPTSAHWYDSGRFDRLLAAHVAHDQDTGTATLVRELVGSFRGLSGSAKQKQILEDVGASRQSLAEFYDAGKNPSGGDGLLAALKKLSTPVKPIDLGVLGQEHLRLAFDMIGADVETFQYSKQTGTTDGGLPWVAEVAFACHDDDNKRRRLIAGLNFSCAINNPFRHLGAAGTGLEALLARQLADAEEPVIVFVHLTCPVLAFTDRGKGTLILDDAAGAAIREAVGKVTKEWAKQRISEIRHASAQSKRRAKLARSLSKRVTIRRAAFDYMERAWLAASDDGTLPANARQVMYAARKYIQEATGKLLDDDYFTQTLLPDYVNESAVEWDIVYDDRGHFLEPSGHEFGLGTVAVRDYLTHKHKPFVEQSSLSRPAVKLLGPAGNYSSALFVEKEGFDHLLRRVKLELRFDVAVMSTKGMSVTAARQLIEGLVADGVKIFVLHDFDKAGFSIASTLQRNTRRYQFQNSVSIIDLGLRLEDIVRLGLEDKAEQANDAGSREARAQNMRRNGATEAEVEFLLHRRVELNALTSKQLVNLIETKLRQHGVEKIIPDDPVLAELYAAERRYQSVRNIFDQVMRAAAKREYPPPDAFRENVTERLQTNPGLRWHEAVTGIANEEAEALEREILQMCAQQGDADRTAGAA